MKPSFTRSSRANVLVLLTCGVVAIFIVRLFYLQIIQHSYYVNMANSEQLKQLVIPAKRGEIYALDGATPVKLVMNQAVYTVFADPKIITDPDKVVKTIEQVAGGNARSNLAGLLANKESRYQVLATNITRKQAELIKQADLSGVGFQEGSRRVYPEGQLAAQTLGFVDANGHGQYGVEGGLNTRLTGTDGLLQSVTDISNVPLTIGDNNINTPAKNGDDIVLTIDRNVQAHAEQALKQGMEAVGASNGSVIVMDPKTSQVMAMANWPSYDPADFSKVNDIAVFNNGVVSTPYEPGSVMKTFTSAIGIDKGVITPESTYVNTDKVVIDGWTIGNASKGQTGTITIQHALNWSLNTGFVTVAERLGDGSAINMQARNTMYDYLHDKFHLGELSGIELGGEAAGEIIPPTNPEGNAVRYANMSFGQGMNLTMLQVAAGFSAIVNGGTYHVPSIVAGQMNGNGFKKSADTPGTRIIAESTAATTKQMVHDARAAFYSANDKSGYDIGGKTGTSQTLINGSYDNNQTIGSYLGYGGDGTPRYVIMVQVSGPGKNFAGNHDAMPIFTDISNWMIDYLQLQPKR